MNLKTLLSATAILAASPSAFALANETPTDTARHILNFEDVELSALIADVSTAWRDVRVTACAGPTEPSGGRG